MKRLGKLLAKSFFKLTQPQRLVNPPGAVWHHPANDPGKMQLLFRSDITKRLGLDMYRSDGRGGFKKFPELVVCHVLTCEFRS